MTQLIAIALGGALGSVLRFLLSKSIQTSVNSNFPFGILTVNVLGCFFMGILASLFLDRLSLAPVWRAGILIGLLGGFTTFSTFSIDTVNLLKSGVQLQALFYVVFTITLCVLATWCGILLARSI